MTKKGINKRYDDYGRELHNLKMSYRKAYINSFIYSMGASVFLSFIYGWIMEQSGHFWDALILGLCLTIPPVILGVRDAINEQVKKAEKDGK